MDQPDGDGARNAADRPDAAAGADTGERPNRNVARGEATRAQLIAIATRMFAERGYEDTSIEAVLREAGVSRGSLYHHFASKEALFEAVAEEVETSTGAQTAAAASGATSPVDALRAGFLAWIRLAGDPAVQRILLIDGPAVLGWDRWRSMGSGTPSGWSGRCCRSSRTRQARGRNWLAPWRTCCSHPCNEVALLVAQANDKETAMRDGAEAIDELLRRLFS